MTTDYTELIKSIMREHIAAEVFDRDAARDYVESLVRDIASDYDMLKNPYIIKYHARYGSHAGANYMSSWRMTFGEESMAHFFLKGPREYPRLQYMLDSRGLDNARGYTGLRILVLHEFAHCLQYFFNKATRERRGYNWYWNPRPHGIEFKNFYSELLDRYMESV